MKDVYTLEGEELDFWVAKALGKAQGARVADTAGQMSMRTDAPNERMTDERFSPHQNPAHAYPIIERARISTRYVQAGTGGWLACSEDSGHFGMSTTSLLEAAMRCFVAMHYGPEVDETLATAAPESDPARNTQAADKPDQANRPHGELFPVCGQQDAWL